MPNQTEIATEEFCPKSLVRKQNEIDFIESHIQILHHLKIALIKVVTMVIVLSNIVAASQRWPDPHIKRSENDPDSTRRDPVRSGS